MSRHLRPVVTVARFSGTLARRLFHKLRRRPVHGYVGWLGQGNVGDESTFLGIRRLRPDVTWLPIGRASRLATALGLDGPAYFKSIALGGGTLINPGNMRHRVQALLNQGHTLWCCGTGVGSVGWAQEVGSDLSAWKSTLRDFKGIGVRGPKSQEQLEAMGVPGVTVCGDLALALARDSLAPLADPPILAVNASVPIRTSDPIDSQTVIGLLVSVAKRWRQRGGCVLPLATDQADLAPLARFCTEAGVNETHIRYSVKPLAALHALAPCSALIGVRLHSAVLAACVGLPPILLGYRPKCLDFMLSMGLEDAHIDLLNPGSESLEAQVESILKRPAAERADILRRAQHWARVQQEFVDSMVQG